MLIKQHQWVYISAVILVLCCTVLQLAQIRPIEHIQNIYFDQLQKMYPRPEKQPSQVVIIDIDEASLAHIGQWPWNRQIIAKLIDQLHQYQVAAIGLDIIFAEYDRTSPNRIAENIMDQNPDLANQLLLLPSNEQHMTDAMKKTPTVVAYSATQFDNNAPKPKSSVKAVIGPKPKRLDHRFAAVLTNVPEIDHAAKGHGIVSFAPEADGVIRRAPLVKHIDERFYPNLSLELIRVALKGHSLALKSHPDGIQGVVLQTSMGNIMIPTDNQGRIWIYYSKSRHAHSQSSIYISAKDILSGEANPDLLKRKLVLVGTSAIGLKDIRSTPITSHMPGVEVHANMIENMLEQLIDKQPFLQRENKSSVIEAMLTLALSFITLLICIKCRIIYQICWLFIPALGLMSYSISQFLTHRLLFDPITSLIIIGLCYTWVTLLNYLYEEREKKHVFDAFNHYLSPSMVTELSQSPDKLKLGGETKHMTILFCDIRNFTSISETFKDSPEQLTKLINQVLTPLTEIIHERQGTIDKYIGDCIMAFWNAPLTIEEPEKQALLAATAMLERIIQVNEDINAKLPDHKQVEIKIGIGINSGPCLVGNLGSEQRFDYSVLGDPVNLASRLESQCKAYGVELILGEDTAKKCSSSLLLLDWICVKGKKDSTAIYTSIPHISSDQHALHHNFLEHYKNMQWEEALSLLKQCREQFADKLALYHDMMQTRIHQFQKDPPKKPWDGAIRLTEK